VSVIDKWLNYRHQNDEAATSATSATSTKNHYVGNGLDVAAPLLQAATFHDEAENVATCSSPVATENAITDQALKGNVADVANVAARRKLRADAANTAGKPEVETDGLCCECNRAIDERLPTSWGGRPCHRACGEAAWRRAVAEGRCL
jgi:hypothetical protein